MSPHALALSDVTTNYPDFFIPDLKNYDISEVTGFLPERPPLKRLPGTYYECWERILDHLQGYLLVNQLRHQIDKLPNRSLEHLGEDPQVWHRAYLVLSFLASCYVWGRHKCQSTPPPRSTNNLIENESDDSEHSVARIIPSVIAIPLAECSKKLGLRPILCYAAVDLWNWQQLDPSLPLSLDNVATLHTCSGTMDESWFYLIPVGIELEGAPALPMMVQSWQCVVQNEVMKLNGLLKHMNTIIEKISLIFRRMHDRCDPGVFYNQIRPYLAGWGLAQGGVMYEGVSPKDVPMTWHLASGAPDSIKQIYLNGEYPVDDKDSVFYFAGGSAAQSSLIQAFDVFLGVEHHETGHGPAAISRPSSADKSPKRKIGGFIHEMREYMPEPHRRFLQDAERAPSVREFVSRHAEAYPDLIASYNEAVESIRKFRDLHLQMVARYIIMQAKKNKGLEHSAPSSDTSLVENPKKKAKTVDSVITTTSLTTTVSAMGEMGSKGIPQVQEIRMSETKKYTVSTLTAATTTEEEKGTGGTLLIPFLKQTRDETVLAKVASLNLSS